MGKRKVFWVVMGPDGAIVEDHPIGWEIIKESESDAWMLAVDLYNWCSVPANELKVALDAPSSRDKVRCAGYSVVPVRLAVVGKEVVVPAELVESTLAELKISCENAEEIGFCRPLECDKCLTKHNLDSLKSLLETEQEQ